MGELCHAPTAAELDLGGVRALIVATTGGSRDHLRHVLVTCGGTAVGAPNAEQALQADTFDVALLDTQSLDAVALAREIRTDEKTKSLPLVLVSTVERPVAELKQAGIDGSLNKPCTQRELFNCVAKVTGRLNVVLSTDDREDLEADAWGASRRDRAQGRQFEAAGALVLLAEDHPVNRQVATTMLETLNCNVDVAVDGVEAVEAVQRKRYDLVFLDCQMPKVDRYEAARQIRRVEEQNQVCSTSALGHSGHLPIVALTAHTAPVDRARSLESGMDDFVSKPFNLRTLSGVLGRWVGGRFAEVPLPADTTSTQPRGSADDGPLSEAALEQILELDQLNGGGVFVRFARTFLEAVPITLENLRVAVAEDDAPSINKPLTR